MEMNQTIKLAVSARDPSSKRPCNLDGDEFLSIIVVGIIAKGFVKIFREQDNKFCRLKEEDLGLSICRIPHPLM